jgi:putative SOS response-associated peptidase YedK
MCGRFVSKETKEALGEIFSATHITPRFFAPSHNVAPTESVPIILEDPENSVGVELGRFGMRMTAAGKSFPLLNLQSEKAANREDLQTRRCIIPASGFYEWEKLGKEKQPYFFSARAGLLPFAGVWKKEPDGYAFSIFTTTANELIQPVHSRMPVILGHNAVSRWLAPNADRETLHALMQPYPAQMLQAWKVSKAVNYVKNKGEECINSL